MKKVSEFLANNKKLVVPCICFLLVLLAFFVFLGKGNSNRDTTSEYSEKFRNHLISSGYNCEVASTDENGNERPYEFYCTTSSSGANSVSKSFTFDTRSVDALETYYTESSLGHYKITIGGNVYLAKGNADISIVYYDLLNNRTYTFKPAATTFVKGEMVDCSNISTTSQAACEEGARKVNAALRTFEGVFEEAKIELVKEK